MMDNASNNDMMLDAIEACCFEEGIDFSATQAWMRCMPHTIHLACIKVHPILWYLGSTTYFVVNHLVTQRYWPNIQRYQ